MQINNNGLQSLLQLEKRLEESTKKLAQLNHENDSNTKHNKNSNPQKHSLQDEDIEPVKETPTNPYEERNITLAYNVDKTGIHVQNKAAQTLIDIKV